MSKYIHKDILRRSKKEFLHIFGLFRKFSYLLLKEIAMIKPWTPESYEQFEEMIK